MAIYAIADLHLSKDPSVGKPMDRFGPVWVNHDEKIEKNWRETVSDEDTVIVAGDISWGLKLEEAMYDLKWLHELPGKKILVKGNHDLWWHSINKLNSLFEDIVFLQNKAYEVEDVFICGSRGWDCPGVISFEEKDEKIYKRETLRLELSLEDAKKKNKNANMIGVLHYPPTNDKFQASEFTRLFEKYDVKEVVYGHLHGYDGYKRGYIGNMNGVNYNLVSVDYVDFKPVKLWP